MSCNEIEKLFVSDPEGPSLAIHAASCPSCAAAARDLSAVAELVSALRPPAWSASLRESLCSLPRRTVTCETADELTARMIGDEGEIAAEQRRRLDFHLSRCEGCAEAARTLHSMRELSTPLPGPWLAGRVAALPPKRSTSSILTRKTRLWLLDPKAAIALAYAAAVAVMIFGFNPADLARRAETDIPAQARSVVADAQGSLADRFGALRERAFRASLVVKSRVLGYGRAALSDAVQLVMKSETPTPRGRARGSEERPILKNETSITTWRV